eukprot:TRINITY_DN4564_c0_g1_i1.p1 TRINITY_DN4564_c0_g1~~TRINITY_DN4564_c0_g1_i1.p1  ORF type:complete len:440 (+),score=116.01 TRINITY_DN4564_c0_g1_i1:28-1347(+)
MALKLTTLDLERECVQITNTSRKKVSLQGLYFRDINGRYSCKPFDDYTIAPSANVTFWTCPAKAGLKIDDGDNLLWRNKNGKPRAKAVLNDQGDGLELVDGDTVVAMISSQEEDVVNTSDGDQEAECDQSPGRELADDDADGEHGDDQSDMDEDVGSQADESMLPDFIQLDMDDQAAGETEHTEGQDYNEDGGDNDNEDGTNDDSGSDLELDDEDIDQLVAKAFERAAVAAQDDVMRPLSSSLRVSTFRPSVARAASVGKAVKLYKPDNEFDELMSSSVLNQDSRQRQGLAEVDLSRNKQKGLKKATRVKTAGKQWFDMQSSELTPQVAADLKLLRMRDVLDRKRHYKSADSKGLPTHFQMGRVIDGAADYYSEGSTKKAAKRSLVDELLDDANKRKYNKTRYVQLVANKYSKVKRRKQGNAATGFKAKRAKSKHKRPF